MKRIYQFSLVFKVIALLVTIVSWYGTVLYTIIDKYNIWYIIPSIVITFLTINSLYHKLILDDEGIKMEAIGFVWRKCLKWDEIETIISERYFGVPIYILVPKEGRAMYLSGYKNSKQLLFDIYNFAPHLFINPKIKRKIERIKKKMKNLN
ncbi:hypothetical protein BBF96_08870 [Anoxybacter fermentans]|uniref:Uncharacterized protein n=1 Tax=Anoxybacter fermentans TaxID=1323375 RepID=A0A3Q9HQL1_9FIRM|nr:hypothetical protein [Anoxybacter fermentans]AZR73485.1 hypothetical protein BBF96_08870 [Anoxybacter fermentans]